MNVRMCTTSANVAPCAGQDLADDLEDPLGLHGDVAGCDNLTAVVNRDLPGEHQQSPALRLDACDVCEAVAERR